MMKVHWFCELCSVRAPISVNGESDPGVWEAVKMIDDDHRKKSPDCKNLVADLRLDLSGCK